MSPSPNRTPPSDAEPPVDAHRRHLDVRPLIAGGEEPYDAIMAAIDALAAEDVLVLETPFDPAPLHRVLGKRGFARRTHELGADHIVTEYWRPRAPAPEPAQKDDGAPAGSGGLEITVDVRGLAPPEPVEITLASLEGLPDGARLIQLVDRVPVFLLPHLDELGFEYSIAQDEDGTVVTIWRPES